MPCYLVTDKEAKDGEPKGRLVEANNSAAARNHVTRDRFEVKQASPHDVASIVKAGGEIEVSTGAEQVEEELPQVESEQLPKDKLDVEEIPPSMALAEEQQPKSKK